MSAQAIEVSPVNQLERILLIDSLRGFAILGILLMNIVSFGLDPWIGSDPTLLNEIGTINYSVYLFVMAVMNGTQRALFSMLFGAGVILFIGRKESKIQGLAPADYFIRRQIWLMVISLFDVYILLWNGDILFDYACYGMVIFAFRNLSPKRLILTAAICLLFMCARENLDLYRHKGAISKGQEITQIDTTATKLTKKQKSQLEDMNGRKKRSTKESKLERSKKAIETVQGDYSDVYEWRTDEYLHNLIGYTYLEAWDVFVFMFLGMALLRLGVLTGEAPVKWYVWMTVIGLGVGLTLAFWRYKTLLDFQYNYFELVQDQWIAYYQLDRTFRAVGLLGLLLLLYKSGVFGWLFSMLRPVGQMALTNYLSQSLICGMYFNGYGFGMFGKLERYEVYIFVLIVWTFQIILCNIWMRFFLYGPAEWLWRSLTYWKQQPFVKVSRALTTR